MKRLISALLLAVFLCVSVTGCGKNSETGRKRGAKGEDATPTLTVTPEATPTVDTNPSKYGTPDGGKPVETILRGIQKTLASGSFAAVLSSGSDELVMEIGKASFIDEGSSMSLFFDMGREDMPLALYAFLAEDGGFLSAYMSETEWGSENVNWLGKPEAEVVYAILRAMAEEDDSFFTVGCERLKKLLNDFDVTDSPLFLLEQKFDTDRLVSELLKAFDTKENLQSCFGYTGPKADGSFVFTVDPANVRKVFGECLRSLVKEGAGDPEEVTAEFLATIKDKGTGIRITFLVENGYISKLSVKTYDNLLTYYLAFDGFGQTAITMPESVGTKMAEYRADYRRHEDEGFFAAYFRYQERSAEARDRMLANEIAQYYEICMSDPNVAPALEKAISQWDEYTWMIPDGGSTVDTGFPELDRALKESDMVKTLSFSAKANKGKSLYLTVSYLTNGRYFFRSDIK